MGNVACCANPSFSAISGSYDAIEIVQRLRLHPELLCAPRLTAFLGLNDSLLHLAAESRSLDALQHIFNFLAEADAATYLAALRPYCRRRRLQPPTTAAAATRLAANMLNNKGQTPLMYACYGNCPDIVKLLLEQGADPWVGDNCGSRNALHYAAMAGSAACVEALMKHVMPHMLVRQGVSYINSRSLSGLTPLHYCVCFGSEAALRQLLLYEPNINAASSGESYDTHSAYDIYSTPLHFAALQDSLPMARLLLLHYARRRRLGSLLDPRLRANSAAKLPWQVARNRDVATLLHPAADLGEVLGREGEEALLGLGGGDTVALGPPALAAVAAAALRQKLLAAVEVVERECVEEAEMWRQLTGRAASFLKCTTPRRGAAGPPDCRGGPRELLCLATRSLARSTSRRGRSARRHITGGAAVMPASPRRAPTLDRVPYPSDFASTERAASEATSPSAPSLGQRSRGAQSPTLGGRATGGGPNGRATGNATGNGNGNGNGWMSRAAGGRTARGLQSWRGSAAAGLGNSAGVGVVGDSGYGGVGVGTGGSCPADVVSLMASGVGLGTAYDGATSLPPAGGVPYGALTPQRSTMVPPGPNPFAAAGGEFVDAPCGIAPTLPGGASPTTPYYRNRPLPTSPTGEVTPAGASPTRGGCSILLGTSDENLRYTTPYDGNGLSRAASLIAGSCVDFDAAAAAVTRAAATAVDDAGGEEVRSNGGVGDGGDEANDDDDDYGLCNLCFARPEAAMSAACRHGLCTACAGELCRALLTKPLLCPFCRRPVNDFVRMVKPAPTSASARRR